MERLKAQLATGKLLKKIAGMKLAAWNPALAEDVTTGGYSPDTLNALARKRGYQDHGHLQQAEAQNAQQAVKGSTRVGALSKAYKVHEGKSDVQMESDWQRDLLNKKQEAAAAATDAMPGTGAHSPQALRAQGAVAPPPASGVRPRSPIVPMLPKAPQLTPRPVAAAAPVMKPPTPMPISGVRPIAPKMPVIKPLMSSLGSSAPLKGLLNKVASAHFLQELEAMFKEGAVNHELFAKAAFAQSQYGSTGGFVDFNQTSDLPPFKVPDMAKKVTAKTAAPFNAFSKPKLKAPGPSIAQQFKPKGFGRPLEGATQGAM